MNFLQSNLSHFGQSTIMQGDALRRLDELENESVQLIVTSPPYNIGKIYERDVRLTLDQYAESQAEIIEKLVQKLRPSGSICWQVGNYVKNGEVIPLDYIFYPMFLKHGMKLRNRIIWRFNFGLNATKRFSGRYETLLWFTKTDEYIFNLDPVRIPQKYPGKRHSKAKGSKAGLLSGNRGGKNPSDIWEFSSVQSFRDDLFWELPNVKANHPEKTMHPCQFPSELAERCVLAFSGPHDTVLDPFLGAGTTVIAAIKHGRHGLGIDKSPDYVALAEKRVEQFRAGSLRLREAGRPIFDPKRAGKVGAVPPEWDAEVEGGF